MSSLRRGGLGRAASGEDPLGEQPRGEKSRGELGGPGRAGALSILCLQSLGTCPGVSEQGPQGLPMFVIV